MSKNIEFYNSDYKFVDIPQPSKQFIPEWYKDSKRYFPDNKLRFINGNPNLAIKHCIPFLESLTSGYIAVTWCDIMVTKTEIGLKIDWRTNDDIPVPLSERPKSVAETLPIPAGHSNQHFAWHNIYQIKLPDGYSLLLTHPFNRFDLPFTTLSGIVDADYGMQQGNVPFFIKEDFEGIIPAGTPMFQVLPFKREGWTSSKNEKLNDLDREHSFNNMKKISGFYKDKFWNRKKYD
jgi:hypothetical protein